MGSGGSSEVKDSKDAKKKSNEQKVVDSKGGKRGTSLKENSARASMKGSTKDNMKGGTDASTKGSKVGANASMKANAKNNSKQNSKASDTKKSSEKGKEKPNDKKSKKSGGKANEQPLPPIRERGYKKLMRAKIRDATIGHDMEYLTHAIDVFERNQLEDDGDLTDAYNRLEYLTMKKDIRDAILRRHPRVLERAIAEVGASRHKADLQQSLDKANETLQSLKTLDQYRHEILSMDQKAISEIRSYNNPPNGVRETMMCTYLLLGYKEAKVRDWQELRALLGRHGKMHILKEIDEFDQSKVTPEISNKVKEIQSKFTQDEVRVVSSGAATFYMWNERVVGKPQGGQVKTAKKTTEKTSSKQPPAQVAPTKTGPKTPTKQSQSQGASPRKKTKG